MVNLTKFIVDMHTYIMKKGVIAAALSYSKGTGLSTILSHGGQSRSCTHTVTESEQLNYTKRAALQVSECSYMHVQV